MTGTETTARAAIGGLAAGGPARPPLPYSAREAEAALEQAGYVYPAVIAGDEPMAASWLILRTLATKPGIGPDDRQALNILWRLLRMATLASGTDYEGIIPDEEVRDPTLADAVALMLRERAIHPEDVPAFASALRNAGLGGMATAVAAARSPD